MAAHPRVKAEIDRIADLASPVTEEEIKALRQDSPNLFRGQDRDDCEKAIWRFRRIALDDREKAGKPLNDQEKAMLAEMKLMEQRRGLQVEIDKPIQQAISRFADQAREEAEVPEQMYLSFMPNGIARTTPFFPMKRNAHRPFETLEFDTSWGHIKMEGRKLSIYDESVLLAILSIVRRERTQTITTSPYEICKIMGVTACKSSYVAIWHSVKRLTGTYIELQMKSKSENTLGLFGTILTGGSTGAEATGKISVNPYFLQTLAAGFLSVDVGFRAKLKGEISKSLYRFLLSQHPNPYEIHLIKLARAVNLHENATTRKVRYQVRNALKELKVKGFLSRYLISKHDIVKVWKSKKPSK